jgi:GNAT superfamily N-acetyltransferase
MIRDLEMRDVGQVVAVHLCSFPGFFLSLLGSRFLSLFYSGIVSATEGIGFVYLDGGGVPVGFVAGASNPGGFYTRLLKRYWLKFGLASILPVLRKPSIIKRVARAVFHPAGNPVGENFAGLFSIGVRPELQGTGAGKLLVQAFLSEAQARGCTRVYLSTDRDSNEVVNEFYLRCGFTVERQYATPEGRRMNELWMTLPDLRALHK